MGTFVEVRKELLDGVRPAITTLFVAGLVSPDWFGSNNRSFRSPGAIR
jgi:hypothetical protein